MLVNLNMDIFLIKTHGFAYMRPLCPPSMPHEACLIMDANALFDVLWTVEQKHLPTAMITLGRARTIII